MLQRKRNAAMQRLSRMPLPARGARVAEQRLIRGELSEQAYSLVDD
jgi:hypothetical protein